MSVAFRHLPTLTQADVTANFEQLVPLIGVERLSVLPAAPFDGQELDYVASEANGVVWRFRYRSASASAHKWEFVGGAALYAKTEGETTTTSETYATGKGPSITVPLAGDYEIGFTAQLAYNTTGLVFAAIKLGAAAASDNDAALVDSSNAVGGKSGTTGRTMTRTGLAAAAALEMVYRISGGAGTLSTSRREMWTRPVRVG